MSKYRKFAEKADAMAKEAFKKVNETAEALQRAQSKAAACPQRNGMVDAEYAAKSARAAADLAEAKAAHERAKAELQTLNKNIAEVRAELVREIEKDNRADPELVDTATMELLKSGILTTDDYQGLFEKHSGNRTMQRLIRKYANETADNMPEARDRQTLKALAASTDTDSAVLANFDVIAEVCHRAEHNTGMIQHYESLTAQAIKEM